MRMFRLSDLAFWGIALCLSTGALAQAAPPPAPSVTVAKPVVKEITEWDDFIGRFEAINQVDIRSRVPGYLDKVHFRDGSMVEAGALLFTIDQRPYQAALEQAEATVASAQVSVDFTSNDLERAKSLRRTGNISDQLLDQRRSTYRTARAELDRAQAALPPGQTRNGIHQHQSAHRRAHLAQAGVRGQPHQREPDRADEYRLA